MRWSGVCVSSGFASALRRSCFPLVVALRIELSAARLSAEHGQPALDDLFVESGTSGSNRKPPAPKAGVLPTAPLPDVVFRSVRTVGFEPRAPTRSVGRSSSPNWRDNQTSLRSDVSSPYGSRTHLSALKERYPAPIDERAVLCCCERVPFTQWTGRPSNPRLLLFRQVLDRLSYQSVFLCWMNPRKKPDVVVTPGFA